MSDQFHAPGSFDAGDSVFYTYWRRLWVALSSGGDAVKKRGNLSSLPVIKPRFLDTDWARL
jgi:hypothetical protein